MDPLNVTKVEWKDQGAISTKQDKRRDAISCSSDVNKETVPLAWPQPTCPKATVLSSLALSLRENSGSEKTEPRSEFFPEMI